MIRGLERRLKSMARRRTVARPSSAYTCSVCVSFSLGGKRYKFGTAAMGVAIIGYLQDKREVVVRHKDHDYFLDAATFTYLWDNLVMVEKTMRLPAKARVLKVKAVAALVAVGVLGYAGANGGLVWLFSKTNMVAAGTGAAANLATQAMTHGTDWSRYNWGSIGFDALMAIISYRFAAAVMTRFPSPIFSASARAKIGRVQVWKNLGINQTLFLLYGVIVGIAKSKVANTSGRKTAIAQNVEGALQMVKRGVMDTVLHKHKDVFPGGNHDPKFVLINRVLTFIIKTSLTKAFGIVPRAKRKPQPSGAR